MADADGENIKRRTSATQIPIRLTPPLELLHAQTRATMSIPYVLRNYTHFQRSVDLILDEPGSTDTHLHERATASLQVFDEPGCLIFNESVRVTPDCLGESKFSSKHLIEAFYHTAQDLNLANGSRYILASVCACARVADAAAQEVGTGSPTSGLLHSEILARELQALAQDVWLMHLGTLREFLRHEPLQARSEP